MSEASGLCEELKSRAARSGAFTMVKELPAREARWGEWPGALRPELRAALEKLGRPRPYSHQSHCFEVLQAGRHAVVVTPTASGKTLCYNVPVLQELLVNPESTALYMFPTKALAQDQLAGLQAMLDAAGSRAGVFTFDGDTPAAARTAVRTKGAVVISNPDMLHQGILPNHVRWARFFSALKYVVIDELHTYRGVFGSHLANLLRRLRRVCAFHGSHPQFVMCSATIANPRDLAEKLLGEPVELVDDNGAPQGHKTVFFYNPPYINETLGIRHSCMKRALGFAGSMLDAGLQTLIFTGSRSNVEIMTRHLKQRYEKEPYRQGSICGYRGGYLPNERRRIEKGIRQGTVRGVVSTNALELGIDIGSLQGVVLAGYPGTVAGAWQQIGRAGRRAGDSLAVVVARSEPLDQFVVDNPDFFFQASPECALINPDNLAILVSHIKCASFEIPFREGERYGGRDIGDILDYLVNNGILFKANDEYMWTDETYPADSVSLRSASPYNFTVHDITSGDKVIAEVDWTSVPMTLYENAVYMLQADTYYVERLDYEKQRASVKRKDSEYYTEAISGDTVRVIDMYQDSCHRGMVMAHGEVHVATKVSGFKKIKFSTRENVGYGKVSLPVLEMHTSSFWLTLSPEFLHPLLAPEQEGGGGLSRQQILTGVTGLAYCWHNLAPLFLMCDHRDLRRHVGDCSGHWSVNSDPRGGRVVLTQENKLNTLDQEDAADLEALLPSKDSPESFVPLEELPDFEPTVFLFESIPGGVGFAPKLYDLAPELLQKAYERVSQCSCKEGCPICVGPPSETGAGAKAATLRLLAAMLR